MLVSQPTQLLGRPYRVILGAMLLPPHTKYTMLAGYPQLEALKRNAEANELETLWDKRIDDGLLYLDVLDYQVHRNSQFAATGPIAAKLFSGWTMQGARLPPGCSIRLRLRLYASAPGPCEVSFAVIMRMRPAPDEPNAN